jgi:hypothetical protein
MNARPNSASGTCKNVTNNMKANAGFMPGSKAVVPEIANAITAATITAAK